MSSQSLYRWSGVVLLAGSLIGLIGAILDKVLYFGVTPTPEQTVSTSFAIDSFLFLAWALLLTMGLPGLYLRQATRAGVLGFIGFGLAELGFLLAGVGFAIVQLTIYPYLAQSAPRLIPSSNGTGPLLGVLLWWLGPGLMLTVGNILLGIATIRTRIFPWQAGLLLIVAAVLSIFTSLPFPSAFGDVFEFVSNVVLFVALAIFGSRLVTEGRYNVMTTERSIPAAQTSR
jgi:hypothetical protein